MQKDESVKTLVDFQDTSLGHTPFLERGCIIDFNNDDIGTCPVLGKRRHWHIYKVENYNIVGVTSLSDEALDKLIKFIDEIQEYD